MATTSVNYKHPYATLQWLHAPTDGAWQDASLLSGYVGGQGTKTLEIDSATPAEAGFLKCVITNPAGASVESSIAALAGEALAPNITVGITNKTPYEGESAVYGPITVTGSPAPTLTWEAETADGSNVWADANTVFGADGSGQGTTTYTIANAQPADNRDIRVRAANSEGEAISQAALTVTPTLEFTTPLNNETITATP